MLSIEWVKVISKLAYRIPIHDFMFDGNIIVCHNLQDIRYRNVNDLEFDI